MNKKFGQQIKELYTACSNLSKSEQTKLISTSVYSSEVKQKVANLLNYSGDIDADLSQIILNSAKSSLNITSIQANDTIDKYQLVQLIGEGGQGEVWLAHRIDGEFNHNVAIKFIKLSPNEAELQRFQTERELLASLQHNNIATLIDGGKYDDRLYMVMEWIDGIQLLEYISEKNLTLKQTLQTFLQICSAVSYAHSKGIIHRDIKPSNILITKDGVIKLLDFGIAKPINSEATMTQSNVMMTLAYSSPEQINGRPVSIATDIYALGLILYELLTSIRAQDNATDSHAEFVKTISEITPVKPSALNQSANQKFPIRKLKGDLDNMVMMSIRKEPSRRYKNVDSLITDVENYLQEKPLIASGDSLSYKVKKLVKRNPLASFLFTCLFMLLLLLPIIMYQNGKKIEKERDIANEHVLIANKTTDFLTTLFQSASPLGNNGQAIDLQDVLAQGERQLAKGLENQPKVAASLSMILASVQFHLDEVETAISHYSRAAELYKIIGDANGELGALGQLAVTYYRNDELEKSKKYFHLADNVSDKIDNNINKAWHNIRKATLANERNQREKAVEYANNAIAILNSEQREDIVVMGRIYSELGEAFKYSDMQKSLDFNEKSLEFAKQDVGEIHPYYLSRLNSKAVRLMRLNKNHEAKKVLDDSIIIAETLYSKNHPKYANVIAAVGDFHHNLGEFDKALIAYSQAKEIYLIVYGKFNFQYARITNNIAYLYEDMEEFKKAESLYVESIELRKKLDPDNIYRIANAKSNLARLLSKTKKFNQSKELIKSVIPVFTLNNRNNLYNEIIILANTINDGNNPQECIKGMDKLVKLEKSIQQKPDKSWKRMAAELWIAQMLNSCGYTNQSKEWLNSAYKMSKTIYSDGSMGQKLYNDWKDRFD